MTLHCSEILVMKGYTLFNYGTEIKYDSIED